MKNKFYSLEKASDTEANLYIYGDIVNYRWDDEDVNANSLKNELEALGDLSCINVHINSYGGDTFQGLAIHNILKQHSAKVNIYVDGIAASSASIIAMAGDKVYMPRTALMMIHNCWTCVIGNADELRKTAEDMDKIAEAYKSAYMAKVNITKEKLEELLTNETYLTADECIEMGFADEIIEDEKIAVNSFANKSILNLVNRLKVAEEKNKSSNIEKNIINAEKITINGEEIEDKIKQILDNMLNKNKTKDLDDNPNQNQIKEDAWASFFNIKK